MRIIVPDSETTSISSGKTVHVPLESRNLEMIFEDELKKRGFVIKHAKDDGNCLFRSIGTILRIHFVEKYSGTNLRGPRFV
jgi:hypothetical protein